MDRSANNEKLMNFLVYSYFGCDISDPAEEKNKSVHVGRIWIWHARSSINIPRQSLTKRKKVPNCMNTKMSEMRRFLMYAKN